MKADAPHAHLTPFDLAYDLDEDGEDDLEEISDRLRSCRVCFDALATLAHWLTALDHWNTRVGPEHVTRYRHMAALFQTAQSHAHRLDQARRDPAFHQWGLCRLLLEQSRQARDAAPAHALELGELALAVAEALDPEDYDPEWVADLRAVAAAHLGELQLLRRNAEQALELLRSARASLAAGTGRPAIARRISDAESLLASESGRRHAAREGDRACEILSEVPEICLKPGSVHRLLRLCAEVNDPASTADSSA